jgi:hypothetical protein
VRRQQLAPPQGRQDNGDAAGGRLRVQDFGAAGAAGLFLGVVILRIWEAMPRPCARRSHAPLPCLVDHDQPPDREPTDPPLIPVGISAAEARLAEARP